jgi:hypothetical protein
MLQIYHVVNLSRDSVTIVHVDRLKILRGYLDEARKLAMLDQDDIRQMCF